MKIMKTISEVKFTPGPWRFDQYGNVITPSGETLLVRGVAMPGGFHPRMEEAEANTRLLCAAPDLLAACQTALSEIDDALNSKSWTALPTRFEQSRRDGLAKAAAQLRSATTSATKGTA